MDEVRCDPSCSLGSVDGQHVLFDALDAGRGQDLDSVVVDRRPDGPSDLVDGMEAVGVVHEHDPEVAENAPASPVIAGQEERFQRGLPTRGGLAVQSEHGRPEVESADPVPGAFDMLELERCASDAVSKRPPRARQRLPVGLGAARDDDIPSDEDRAVREHDLPSARIAPLRRRRIEAHALGGGKRGLGPHEFAADHDDVVTSRAPSNRLCHVSRVEDTAGCVDGVDVSARRSEHPRTEPPGIH